MGRIDIVIFPDGGAEIFGQISAAPIRTLAYMLADFMEQALPVDKSAKFAGYYEQDDASDMEWQAYIENNPIVHVPVETPMLINDREDELPPMFWDEPKMMPVEFLSLPEEMRGKYRPDFLA